MNANDRTQYMHEEVWAQFDKTMEEANRTFRLFDEAVKEVADGEPRLPHVEKESIRIPLTFRNRLRLICLAFSFAKWMKL